MYSLVDSADGVFSINPVSGVVILEKPLDRETQDSYCVRVQAADQKGAASSLSTEVDLIIMVLDVNDNPPVFQKQDYAVTVPEDVAVGTELLRVFASSKDIGVNAEIYYSITTGNELGKLYIDKNTGERLIGAVYRQGLVFFILKITLKPITVTTEEIFPKNVPL